MNTNTSVQEPAEMTTVFKELRSYDEFYNDYLMTIKPSFTQVITETRNGNIEPQESLFKLLCKIGCLEKVC